MQPHSSLRYSTTEALRPHGLPQAEPGLTPQRLTRARPRRSLTALPPGPAAATSARCDVSSARAYCHRASAEGKVGAIFSPLRRASRWVPKVVCLACSRSSCEARHLPALPLAGRRCEQCVRWCLWEKPSCVCGVALSPGSPSASSLWVLSFNINTRHLNQIVCVCTSRNTCM